MTFYDTQAARPIYGTWTDDYLDYLDMCDPGIFSCKIAVKRICAIHKGVGFVEKVLANA